MVIGGNLCAGLSQLSATKYVRTQQTGIPQRWQLIEAPPQDNVHITSEAVHLLLENGNIEWLTRLEQRVLHMDLVFVAIAPLLGGPL